ncbi:Swt1 family HEPN domain-containing protein [Kribbella sp. NPDC023972]|uniref:Swt1 family HEPN domain-containing protein n=1 Tax=Kribbella sp. NPDC023972 TaxID=3154795 RepID=UPI0033F5803E
MGPKAPGGDWAGLLAARDEVKHGAAKKVDPDDPAVHLRVLTEDWRAFEGKLSRPQQGLASELRETRNTWAHDGKRTTSTDDAYRALDTMERLLQAVGAPDEADEVRRLRTDMQRSAYESQARKTSHAMVEAAIFDGKGLKPWREVITPHVDVISGDFSASEFAADLHMVSRGEGSEEYVDPVEFFRRTYLTTGLRDLMTRAVKRIGGDANASPIVNLQTNFGGGKTHSMLALYHLFSGTSLGEFPQEVQELVEATATPLPKPRSVGWCWWATT